MRKSTLILGALVLSLVASAASWATPAYMRSTVAAPWGQSTNEAAMNDVFGAGNWSDLRYETVNTAALFSASTSFIFMEGGDNNANELEAFLGANSAAISSWVNGGGRLFLNAAPNEGNGMDYGFGVSLNYPNFVNNVVAADAGHPIFNGPFGPVATSYTGTSFSHATVSGAGLNPLLVDAVDGDFILAEMLVGNGLALFGGMTTTNFHSPNLEAGNLRRNIIAYAANTALNAVPEPATLALFGIAALGAFRRRAA
jgi:hypothetical protein